MWTYCAILAATLTCVSAAGLAEHSHPRLWYPKSEEPRIRQTLATDPLARRLHQTAIREARNLVGQRTCRYEIPDGKRLLGESRRALQTIMFCAWAWRSTGEEPFRSRVIAELEAACSLKDWNPSHFLDVAEMATAVATGYDWLYGSLTPQQRSMCEKAILQKALRPAMEVYQGNGWWSNPRNNWSQVCGAGIAAAAVAIAGHDQGESQYLFDEGVKLIQECAEFYQPDGMYPEGPGYWQYGTNYHVLMLALCDTLGQSIERDSILEKAGDAILHLAGNSLSSFNFADANQGAGIPTAAQCWLASQYGNLGQAGRIRTLLTQGLDAGEGRFKTDRFLPLAILWLPAAPPVATSLPKGAVFRGEQSVALFRSGWEADAAWFGIKGGTPAASHGHMDVGSFCYEAHGIRWIHDMGSEDYNLPSYFGSKRWDYYRLQNRSHNTLEIGGKLQNPHCKPCPLISSSLDGNPMVAAFDLTGAYSDSAKKVVRRASFDLPSGVVRIEDKIDEPVGEVVWRAFTVASPKIEGNKVILTKGRKSIAIHNLSKSGTWSVADAKPATKEENQNEGMRAIVLTVARKESLLLNIEIRP